MRVSVVVPTYDSRTSLELCLLSLAHQRVDAEHSVEVVVVDDGSTDGTDRMVAGLGASPTVRYVYVPRTAASGRSSARNRGVEESTGDLIVFLDADQVVPPDFLATHLRVHEGADAVVALGPRSQLDDGPNDVERLRREFTLEALPAVLFGDEREHVFSALECGLEDLETGWHYVWTCNVSVRRDRLLAVGGFDTGFRGWGFEDVEFGYRLARSGATFRWVPDAMAFHVHRDPVSAQMYREWAENLAYFARKHDDPVVALQRLLDPVLDPAVSSELSWLETCVRFEHSARGLAGRVPRG